MILSYKIYYFDLEICSLRFFYLLIIHEVRFFDKLIILCNLNSFSEMIKFNSLLINYFKNLLILSNNFKKKIIKYYIFETSELL